MKAEGEDAQRETSFKGKWGTKPAAGLQENGQARRKCHFFFLEEQKTKRSQVML